MRRDSKGKQIKKKKKSQRSPTSNFIFGRVFFIKKSHFRFHSQLQNTQNIKSGAPNSCRSLHHKIHSFPMSTCKVLQSACKRPVGWSLICPQRPKPQHENIRASIKWLFIYIQTRDIYIYPDLSKNNFPNTHFVSTVKKNIYIKFLDTHQMTTVGPDTPDVEGPVS